MNKILKKTYFSEKVVQMVVEAPLIAKSRKPGNFVIVRVGEKGERMPLTISDADPVKGTITLVIQKMGVSSTKLCNLEEGEYIGFGRTIGQSDSYRESGNRVGLWRWCRCGSSVADYTGL